MPPGPEPPPDNAVCHSPNPGPRREGLTIGKRWTDGEGQAEGVSVADTITSDPFIGRSGRVAWPAGGQAGGRGTSSCRCVAGPRAGARARARGRQADHLCRAGSRAARPPPPPGPRSAPDGIGPRARDTDAARRPTYTLLLLGYSSSRRPSRARAKQRFRRPGAEHCAPGLRVRPTQTKRSDCRLRMRAAARTPTCILADCACDETTTDRRSGALADCAARAPR